MKKDHFSDGAARQKLIRRKKFFITYWSNRLFFSGMIQADPLCSLHKRHRYITMFHPGKLCDTPKIAKNQNNSERRLDICEKRAIMKPWKRNHKRNATERTEERITENPALEKVVSCVTWKQNKRSEKEKTDLIRIYQKFSAASNKPHEILTGTLKTRSHYPMRNKHENINNGKATENGGKSNGKISIDYWPVW